tara:strand:- start:2459 stop:2674 length:216 start_codon:yes stop_codon:yes gene_type:complete
VPCWSATAEVLDTAKTLARLKRSAVNIIPVVGLLEFFTPFLLLNISIVAMQIAQKVRYWSAELLPAYTFCT